MCGKEDIRYKHYMKYIGPVSDKVLANAEIEVGCVCARHMLHNTQRATSTAAADPKTLEDAGKTAAGSGWTEATSKSGHMYWKKVVMKSSRLWELLGSPAKTEDIVVTSFVAKDGRTGYYTKIAERGSKKEWTAAGAVWNLTQAKARVTDIVHTRAPRTL